MFWSPAAKDPVYLAAARMELEAKGRVHLPDFVLGHVVQGLHDAMGSLDWRLITNQGGAKTQDLTAAEAAARGAGLFNDLNVEAREDFRFIYDGYRLAERALEGAIREGPFVDFFAVMNTPQSIEMFRAITGDERIVFLDALVSRYRPGHFLTAHDDLQPDGYRLYAYVFNLSPRWRPDWGGLLAFYGSDGNVAEAFTPRWGALNIFKVPQAHAVTAVTPFAGADRYSITGWMRAKRPPRKF